MAKPNYSFEKRKREAAKRAKKEAKKEAKRLAKEQKAPPPGAVDAPEQVDADANPEDGVSKGGAAESGDGS